MAMLLRDGKHPLDVAFDSKVLRPLTAMCWRHGVLNRHLAMGTPSLSPSTPFPPLSSLFHQLINLTSHLRFVCDALGLRHCQVRVSHGMADG